LKFMSYEIALPSAARPSAAHSAGAENTDNRAAKILPSAQHSSGISIASPLPPQKPSASAVPIRGRSARPRGESQRDQCSLLEFRGPWPIQSAGLALRRALHRTYRNPLNVVLDARQYIGEARPCWRVLPAPRQFHAHSDGAQFSRLAILSLRKTDRADRERESPFLFAALFAFVAQLVPDFSAADQDAFGGSDFRDREQPTRTGGRKKSSIGEDASGWRSMLFGVNTTSGLRQRRSACLRSN